MESFKRQITFIQFWLSTELTKLAVQNTQLTMWLPWFWGQDVCSLIYALCAAWEVSISKRDCVTSEIASRSWERQDPALQCPDL